MHGIEGWQVNHKLVRRWLARLGVQTLFIEPGSGGACTIGSDPTAPTVLAPPAPEKVKPADWFLGMPQRLGPQTPQGLT